MPPLGHKDHPFLRRDPNETRDTLEEIRHGAPLDQENRSVEPRTLTSRSPTLSSSATDAAPARPLLSIVVPTKNERDNVGALVERLEAVLPTVAMEIIFVDASTDATPDRIAELAPRCGHDVVLLRQTPDRRRNGLGGAVVQGLRAARAPWACVMDADLQHPPELIAELLEEAESRDLDLVVASR